MSINDSACMIYCDFAFYVLPLGLAVPWNITSNQKSSLHDRIPVKQRLTLESIYLVLEV